MYLDTWQFILLIIYASGACWIGWKAGIKKGAETVVEVLHQKKVIAYDNKGNIKPNPFWQEEEE